MAFDIELMTAASALALYDAARTTTEKLAAAAAMAQVLRTPKPKRVKVAEPETGALTAPRLAAALKRACGVIDKRSTIPVLACVRLTSAGDGKLAVYSTDLDIEWRETIAAEGMAPLDLCVPAHQLAAALRGVKGEVVLTDTSQHFPGETVPWTKTTWDREAQKNVTVTGEEPKASVWSVRVSFSNGSLGLACIDPADSPSMTPPAAQPFGAMLPIERLKRPLRNVAICISAEETRYYLNGAYMHLRTSEGRTRLAFVSTDGSKLMLDEGQEACDFPLDMGGVILPNKAVQWLLAHLPESGDVLAEVWSDARRVCLTHDSGSLTFKTIDGSFPDYMRVIPRGDDRKAVIQVADPKAFAASLGRVTAQVSSRSACVRLTPKNGGLVLSGRSLEGATVEVEAEGVNYAGDGRTFDFNGRYLAEILTSGGPCLIALFGAVADPALISWDAEPGRTAVIMPLRQ